MSNKGMSLRGAIVFAILMGAPNMEHKDPGYVMEKLRGCGSVVPETLLDSGNLAKFYLYREMFRGNDLVDWDTRRDLHDLPIAEVAKRNRGES